MEDIEPVIAAVERQLTRRWGAVIARGVLTLIGVSYGLFAVQLQPPYIVADLGNELPYLWEAVFSAAGLACLVVAAWPHALSLRLVSLATVTLASGLRMVVLLLASLESPYVAGGALSFGQSEGPSPVIWPWVIIVVLQLYTWPTLVNSARGLARRRERK